MKTITIGLIGLLVFFNVLFGQGEPVEAKTFSTNFRKAKWGMSMAQVKKVETQKLKQQSGTVLMYTDTLLDLPVSCLYQFSGEKLTVGAYVFSQKHTNKNDFISDFQRVKKALTKKYGPPMSNNDRLWKNDLYKDDRQQWGFAVSLGHLQFFAFWQTPETRIVLELSGDNYKIKMFLRYDSLKLKTEEKDDSDKL
ncbi:MAG: hypothetical protein GY940_14330 [bacterium]|nr:hypothetical protein [bacterium]